jgi:hypothetical protein
MRITPLLAWENANFYTPMRMRMRMRLRLRTRLRMQLGGEV